jgi:hypothetical protein
MGKCKEIDEQTKTTTNTEKETQNTFSETESDSETNEKKEIESSEETGCDFQFKDSKGKCYICSERFYLNSEFKCMPCSQNCKRCLSDKFCLQCDKKFFLDYDKVNKNLNCKNNKKVSITLFLFTFCNYI